MKRTGFVGTSIMALLILMLMAGVAFAGPYDFGGETVKFAAHYDISSAFAEGEGLAHLQDVEGMFNVNIEFVTMPVLELLSQLPASTMAGDPLGDVIVNAPLWFAYNWYRSGALRPLDDVLGDEYYDSLPEYHRDYVKQYSQVGPNTYAFSMNSLGSNHVIIWNKSLFERDGLPNLYELQESGDWTWDKFLEIARQATRDTDGDGKVDQYGLASIHGPIADSPIPTETAVNLAFTNGGRLVKVVDGRMEFAMDEPAFLEAMNFALTIARSGVFVPFSAQESMDMFVAGRVAMIEGWPECLSWWYASMEDEYGMVMLPKGPRSDDHITIDRGDISIACLPKGTKDAKALVELCNALFELTDAYMDTSWYYDDTLDNFSLYCRDRETLETYEQVLNRRQYQVGREISVHLNAAGPDIARILKGEKTPEAVMAEIKPQTQIEIDEFWGTAQ